MVAPQWGDFETPEDANRQTETQEFSQELPGKIQDEQLPEQEQPQWGFLSPETYQGEPERSEDEESFLSMVGRNALSNTMKLVSKVAGTPGDLQAMSRQFLKNIPSSGGFFGNAIAEWVGKDEWEKSFDTSMPLPTSESVLKNLEGLTGVSSKPKNKTEKRIQDFSEDVGSVVGGIATFGGNLTAANILAIPGAANVAKNTVEELGFGEDKANLAKVAVWLPMSLAFNVNGPKYASKLMNQGRQGVAPTTQSNVARLTKNLDDLEHSQMMLSSDPRSDLARAQINRIRNDLANGQTTVRALMTSYDGTNAAKRSSGLFDLARADRAFARNRINEVNRVLHDEVRDSIGANSKTYNSWNDGLSAWATVHQSNAITDWVQNLSRGPHAKLLTGPTAALFGVGSYAGVKSPQVSLTAAAAIPTVYKTGQVLYRMWNNPDLSRYYWGAISAAQAENLPAFISNYKKLEGGLKKSDTVDKKAKPKK